MQVQRDLEKNIHCEVCLEGDDKEMEGTIDQEEIKKMQNAAVVILCMSKRFKDSLYCR